MRPDDPSTTEPPRRTGDSRLAFLTAWVISAAYMGWLVRLGWIPHDDGALAQAADWVNHGLLPHRARQSTRPSSPPASPRSLSPS
jgi:hypothetical protein